MQLDIYLERKWKTKVSGPLGTLRLYLDGTTSEEDNNLTVEESDYEFWSNSENSNSESE